MPKFAANLSMMFPELEEPQRFAAARDAGFGAVEYLRPYAHPIAEVRRWLDDAGLQLILINSPAGDPARNDRGLAALPGREADFRASLDLTLEYATGLGAGMVHLMAGVVPPGIAVEACEEVFVENLCEASDTAKAAGVRILLEPLNTRDVPGYLHTKTAHTRRLIEESGADNAFLQYDFYHMQIMQGDLVEGLRSNLDIVGHVQVSSLPGRHEPQYGEVNFAYVFDEVDAMGYGGWIGCEYRPKNDTREGLTWALPYGIVPRS
jgi:2-dehydrotetronate isomerase